jgi:dihydrofolate reductase/thymidylate synthase
MYRFLPFFKFKKSLHTFKIPQDYTMKLFSVVVALHHTTSGIGKGNKLPWKIKEDMAFFKELTSNASENCRNAVIMGRNTWESLPAKFRPLPGRQNVVLSRNPAIAESLPLPPSVLTASSLDDAMKQLSSDSQIDKIFVIGGASLYQEAITSPFCQKVYATDVYCDMNDYDVFFPVLPARDYKLVYASPKKKQEDDISYRFTEYDRIDDNTEVCSSIPSVNHEEMQYLNLIHDIMENGVIRGDRTGTGTVSKFGVQMRFSLRENVFPLITSKKVFWRGVAEELLWFVKGSTNAKELQDKNIHIWDGNASRQFLDSIGLKNREEGDLGPVYGFQVGLLFFFCFFADHICSYFYSGDILVQR